MVGVVSSGVGHVVEYIVTLQPEPLRYRKKAFRSTRTHHQMCSFNFFVTTFFLFPPFSYLLSLSISSFLTYYLIFLSIPLFSFRYPPFPLYFPHSHPFTSCYILSSFCQLFYLFPNLLTSFSSFPFSFFLYYWFFLFPLLPQKSASANDMKMTLSISKRRHHRWNSIFSRKQHQNGVKQLYIYI